MPIRRLPTLVLSALFALGITLLMPASSQAQESSAQVQKQSGTWETVKTFEGSGRVTTDSFSVSSSEWRLKWSSDSRIPSGLGHVLQIHVQKPADSTYQKTAANIPNEKTITGMSPTYEAGRYQLQINGVNGTWKVKLKAFKKTKPKKMISDAKQSTEQSK